MATPPRPLLSIAIPVFNGADTIAEAIESIVGQGVSGVEVVISDNASTDGTADIVREIAKRHPAVVLFENAENLGGQKNLDLAVERASGEFVQLFGDDDKLRPGSITRVMAIIRSHPEVGFISCNADVFGTRWVVRHENTLGLAADRILRGVEETFVTLHDHIGLTPTIVVRRNSWLAQGRRDDRIDYWFHVRRVLGIAEHEDTYCLAEPRVMMDQSVVRWNRGGRFLTVIAEFCEMVKELQISPEVKAERIHLWYSHLWTHIVVAKLNSWKLDRQIVARLIRLFRRYPRFWLFDLPLLLCPRFVFRAANAVWQGLRAARAGKPPPSG